MTEQQKCIFLWSGGWKFKAMMLAGLFPAEISLLGSGTPTFSPLSAQWPISCACTFLGCLLYGASD